MRRIADELEALALRMATRDRTHDDAIDATRILAAADSIEAHARQAVRAYCLRDTQEMEREVVL